MSTEVDKAPEELEINKTVVTLTDEEGKDVEFETVGKMTFQVAEDKQTTLYINAFVPTKADGTQDDEKPVEYVVTDSKGEPVDDEEVQKNVTELFIAEVTQEEEKK